MGNGSNIAHEFNKQACYLLTQSCKKLEHCLGQIDFDQCWWRPTKGMNSIGNLLLHMNGNLRQWAIVGLQQGADSRERELEFSSDRTRTPEELWRLTETTVEQASESICQYDSNRLTQRIQIQGFDVTALQAILHTTVHFQGHTHQVILLTRQQLADRYQFEWSPGNPCRDLPM